MSEPKNAEALKDTSRVPLGERQAWSPYQAAQVYSLDYEGCAWRSTTETSTHSARRTDSANQADAGSRKPRWTAGSAAWRNNP